jgi:hypothetical protein
MQLFAPAGAISREFPSRTAWHWLAPAMAMCLLAMMMAGNNFPRSPYLGGAQPSNLLATIVLPDPDWASYYAASRQGDRNLLPRESFEWTNTGYALTTAAPLSDTNRSRP